jgi:hypothetical protein
MLKSSPSRGGRRASKRQDSWNLNFEEFSKNHRFSFEKHLMRLK